MFILDSAEADRALGLTAITILVIGTIILVGFLVFVISRRMYTAHLNRVVEGTERDLHTRVADPLTVAKVIFAICMMILMIWTMVTVSDIKAELETVRNEIRNNEVVVNIPENMEQSSDSLLHDCSYSFGEIDTEKKTIDVFFTVVPKEVTSDSELSVSWGGMVAELKAVGGSYKGSLAAPVFTYVDESPVLTIQRGDILKTEILNCGPYGSPASELFGDFLFDVTADPDAGRKKVELVSNGEINSKEGILQEKNVRSVCVVLRTGDKELKRCPVEMDGEYAQTNVTGVYEVGAGNALDIDLEIVMDYGWTVTISLGSVEPGSEVNAFYASSNTMTVTDKDGKVIYKR